MARFLPMRDRLLATISIVSACSSGDPSGLPDEDAGCPPPPESPVAIQATKIGAPTWKPIDYQSIPTLVGTSADTSPTIAAIESVVSPGHAYYPAVALFGPSQVHAPPYDMELTTGRELAGLVSTSMLNGTNFHAPSGLLSLLLLIPDTGAPTG